MAVIPGTENPETLTGGIENDIITGLGGDDILNGGDGDDVIEGGTGNDVINGGAGTETASYENSPNSIGVFVNLATGFTNGDAGNDTLIGIENVIGSTVSDTLRGNAGNNVLTGLGGDDLLIGEDGDDTLVGGIGGDFLRGRSGNDTLLGGLDDDFLSGGEGNDVMDGGDGLDRVSMFLIPTDPQTGTTVDLAIAGQQDTGHGLDTFISIEHVSGTAFADNLSGNGGDNWLWGIGGNDVLDGRGGNDLLEVGAGQTTVMGGAGTDSLSLFNNQDFVGGVVASLLLQGAAQTVNGSSTVNMSGIENLSGSSYDDVLTGDGGNNVLAGREGADTLNGGDGDDVLLGDGSIRMSSFNNQGGSGPIIQFEEDPNLFGNDILNGGAGNDRLVGGGGDDLMEGEDGDDTLIGGSGQDVLRGRFGNDNLQGGLGADTLNGGEGNDVFDGGEGFDRVSMTILADNELLTGATVDLAIVGQQDTGHGLDTLVNIEHVSGTTFADILSGNGGDNWIWGQGGNDVLDGREGNDLLEVGAGQTTVAGGLGTDSLSFYSNGAFAGGVVASLLLQGAAQTINGLSTVNMSGIENLSGSGFDDTLTGDRGSNVLGGDAGNDTLNGGDGDDVLLGDGYITGFTADYQIAQRNDLATLLGNDILSGGAGNDRLIGGGGNDSLDGGRGVDVAGYATASAAVVVNLGLAVAQDTVGAGIDTLIGIESLEGSVFGDSLTGNGVVNVLAGLAGDDVLDGGKGNDVLDGGEGIDTASYATSASAVTVNLSTALSSGGAGKDSLVSIENVIGSAFRDVLIGDGGANNLRGGDNNDSIDGGAGDDVMAGEAGTDLVTYASSTVGVTVSLAIATAQNTVGAGIDTLSGFEDLTGSKFADNLTGDGLANRITGGVGADVLTGGDGKDRFVYLAVQDSSLKNIDLITDLSRGDILDLSSIDANSVLAGDQAFSLTGAFSGVAGQYTLAFNAVTGQTQLLADVNGDSKADFALLFTGDVTGLTGSWVL
jgi:Ca2+-binding RTX toxin-like protein